MTICSSNWQERAKELNCLYEVDHLLNQPADTAQDVFGAVARAIGPGWQYPDICEAVVEIEGEVFKSAEFAETPWNIRAEISVQQERIGSLTVYYTEERPDLDEGPFLKEEVRLAETIADRIGQHVFFERLKTVRQTWQDANEDPEPSTPEWRVALDMILHSDKSLFLRISRKMLNHLCSLGIAEAQDMLQQSDQGFTFEDDFDFGETNVPGTRNALDETMLLEGRPFTMATRHLSPTKSSTACGGGCRKTRSASGQGARQLPFDAAGDHRRPTPLLPPGQRRIRDPRSHDHEPARLPRRTVPFRAAPVEQDRQEILAHPALPGAGRPDHHARAKPRQDRRQGRGPPDGQVDP